MTTATARATLEERVEGWVQDLCDALELNYKHHSIGMHEASLRDDMHYSRYHEEQLYKIKEGTANLNKYKAYKGRKYWKIVMQENRRHEEGYTDSSVHAFIDRKTGEIYMPAGYDKPNRLGKFPVRFDLRIIKDREYVLNPTKCSWSGGYLYDRSTLPTKYI